MRVKQPMGQLARWLETLSEYDFTLQHRKGLKHNNADGLSRISCGHCKQCARMRDLKEVNGTDQSGLGEAGRLAQAVSRPVPLPRKSLGCTPEIHSSARTSSPSGTPECCWNTRRAVAANETPGAPREVEVGGFTMSTAGEGVPPSVNLGTDSRIGQVDLWSSSGSGS